MGVEIKQVTVNLGDKCPEHKKLIVLILSMVQIILGVLDVAFFIGLLVIRAWPFASGCGIWGGILFIGTGVIGNLAYHLQKILWVGISIGLSIISALFAFSFFIVHAVGISMFDFNCDADFFKALCSSVEAAKALNALLMLVCLALLLVCAALVVFSVLSVIRHTENTDKSQYKVQETNHQVPKMHEIGHDNEAAAVKEDGRNDKEMDKADIDQIDEAL